MPTAEEAVTELANVFMMIEEHRGNGQTLPRLAPAHLNCTRN